MRNPRGSLAFGLLLLSPGALAGCLSETPVHVPDAADLPHGAPWSVAFEGPCWEGGFVAPYRMEEGEHLVEPWVRADIRQELGEPLFSQGGPRGQPISGNWHQGFRCPGAVHDGEAVEDFLFGWVGDVVEPPAWDPGGADLHVFTTGLGLQNGTARDALIQRSRLDVTQTYEVELEWLAENVVYEVMKDEPKGIYDSQGIVNRIRDVPERTIRFWWLVPADGSQSPLGRYHRDDVSTLGGASTAPAHDLEHVEDQHWNPVYLDLHTGGGAQYASPAGNNLAYHGGVAQHGPQGGIWGLQVTVLYEHRALSLSYGRTFEDIVLDDFFWH